MKTLKILFIAIIAIASAEKVFAQNKKSDSTNNSNAIYRCSMHSNIVSNQNDHCPVCGASLNLSPKEKLKWSQLKLYTCPMHPDIRSDKPGKCQICNSNLTPVTEKTEEALYSCPMHPNIKSNKPGKCSICGMTLTKKEKEKQ